jgi:hypothetical protein
MLMCATGKSSLTVQFVDGHFVESYYPTIENTFSKVIRHKGQEYATEIIDTAGQVGGLRLTFSFLWGSHVAVSEVHLILDSAFGLWLMKGNQDEYSILNSKHFIGIHGYMLVYSVASTQSFEMVQVIRDKILNHLVASSLTHPALFSDEVPGLRRSSHRYRGQ